MFARLPPEASQGRKGTALRLCLVIFHYLKRCKNILLPGTGWPLFGEVTSGFVPRVFQRQAELCSQERAHILIAIWVPSDRKITHPSGNAAFLTPRHGPRGWKHIWPRLESLLATTASERGARGLWWAEARVLPHILMHRTASQQRAVWPQTSVVPSLGSPALRPPERS